MTPDATPRRGVALAAAMVVLVVAVAVIAAKVARAYSLNTDDTTGVLEAQSVLSGNLLLSGWTVSNISFYTTDLPFYVAAVALFGPRPALMRAVPAMIYAVAVLAAALLARGHSRGRRSVAAVTTVVVLLGLPAGGLAEFVTKGYVRVGTMLGIFTALLALDPPHGRRVGPGRLVLFAALLALTIVADTAALVLGAVAILTVCLWAGIRGIVYENVRLGRVALAVAGSLVAAWGLSWLISAMGGYHVNPLSLRDQLPYPDPIGVMLGNLRGLAAYLPSLYRCDDAWPAALRLPLLIGPGLLMVVLLMSFPFRRRREPADFIADVLWVSMLLGLLAFVGSGSPKDRDTIRYMIPFVLTGSVLTARVLSARLRDLRLTTLALGLLGLTYAMTVIDDLRKPPAPEPAKALAVWLDARGLRHGYGPYWDASIVTASSGGRVAVRPVRGRPIAPGQLVIEPYRWMSDAHWYHEGPARFVVYRPKYREKYHFLINEQTCHYCFGMPTSRYTVGPYVVLVWDRDLRPLLVRGLPWVP